MMLRWTQLALCLALSCLTLACDDTSSSGDADAQTPRRPVDGAIGRADSGLLPDMARPGDATTVTDAALPDAGADQGPPPECAQDDQCAGQEQVCYDGRCVDGPWCDEGACPDGRLCIAELCVPDPNGGVLLAEPGAVAFSFSDVADMPVRGFSLTNTGTRALNVTRFEFTGAPVFALDPPIALPLRLVPSQSEPVLVRYQPNDLQADQGTLRIHTDLPGQPPAEVQLVTEHKVVGGADPCLQVRPNAINFGPVPRGDVVRQSFELISCGQAPVTIRGVDRGVVFFIPLPDTFQLDNPPAFPLVLAPGERQVIWTTYSPRRAGLEFGFWSIFSDDPANPELRVDVNAAGEPPPLGDVELHVRLNWDTDLTDVDLHLLGPNGTMWTCEGDCFFSNPQPNWGDPNAFEDDPFLDLDDVDGFGPENINLESPQPGTYRVLVHYWADHDGQTPSATVEVLNFGQVIGQYGPVRLDNVDDTWQVVDIEFPALNLTPLGAVNRINRGNVCNGL